MSKIWDDRQKSLEEEYFRRKEKEAIEKLRQKRAQEEERKKAEASLIHCPKCEGNLVEIAYEDVQVDRCDKCHGVWLDAGELERLTYKEKGQGWLSRLFENVSGE